MIEVRGLVGFGFLNPPIEFSPKTSECFCRGQTTQERKA